MPEDIEQIKWLLKECVSAAEIARQFEVTDSTIRYHLMTEDKKNQRNKKTAERLRNARRVLKKEAVLEYRRYRQAVLGEKLRPAERARSKARYNAAREKEIARTNANARLKRLNEGVRLWKTKSGAWARRHYRTRPEFIDKLLTYDPSLKFIE